VHRTLIVSALALLLVGCVSATGPSMAGDDTFAEVAALVGQAQLRMELGEVIEGIQLYRKAVGLAPDDLQLAEEFGLALSRAGMVDEAQQELLRAGDLSPAGAATLGLILSRRATSREELERSVPFLTTGLDAVPLGSQARFQLVQALVDLGRGEEAWNLLQPLLSDRPSDRRLMVLAGQALRLQGKSDEAITYFQRAGEGMESEPVAASGLVDALADEGKFAEAAKEWKKLLDKQGGTAAGWVRYAALLLRARDDDAARAALDQVLEGEPENADGLSLKALLEAGSGNLKEAADLYRQVLNLRPDDPGTAMALARVSMELRSFDEARALLDGLWNRAAAGDLPEGADVEIAEERAALELVSDDADAARPWLDRLGSGPFDRRDLAMWGEYFRLRKAYSDGLKWLSEATTTAEPGATRLAEGLRAEFLLASGQDEEGHHLLKELLGGEIDDVRMGLDVLQRLEHWGEVVAAASAALERLGDSPELRFTQAAALERGKQWDEAVVEFRRLIAADPDNAAALNYLGYMFADRNVNLDEALTMIQRAVELQPRSGAYLDSLGWVHFRLGNLSEAREQLLRAAELTPEDPTVHEHLGDLFAKLGEATKAAQSYREALDREPDEEGQRERIEKKLSELGDDATP
jgi:tetratricopeptide (TPR) repeat protein